MRQAMFYKKLDNKKVLCELCPHYCLIDDNKVGKCKVRENIDGVLYTKNYGMVAAMSMDPIEKKPLYHFYPGENILSVGTFGCNMTCSFCQNYRLSQSFLDLETTPVEDLIKSVDGLGIAFTYNEPTLWYEYVYDVSKALKEKNPTCKVVLVTNGFINKEPLNQLLPYIDAFNVDLKSYNNDFYLEVCDGMLKPVLESIKMMASKHLEVTTLMVSNYISPEDVGQISDFLSTISPNIPLHISRYFPSYKMTEPMTSMDQMEKALEKAQKNLAYVYLGNLRSEDNNTYCKQCKALLIERNGFDTKVFLEKGNCSKCGLQSSIVTGN